MGLKPVAPPSQHGPSSAAKTGLAEVQVERAAGPAGRSSGRDWVVVESPLEIRVDGQPLAVIMRTPGEDRELAAGFLYSEGVIEHAGQLAALEEVSDPEHPEAENLLFVRLDPSAGDARGRLRRAQRELVAAAACGVCGKRRLADLRLPPPPIEPRVPALELMGELPARLRRGQRLFQLSGGLHGAALFTAEGELLLLREDIGRHNAVDKVIGQQLLAGHLPLAGRILLTSGRVGFEIAHKAIRAAVPALGAVGAASSLAIELAAEAGMELFSFLAPGRGNRHL